jgi:hypothetical protein
MTLGDVAQAFLPKKERLQLMREAIGGAKLSYRP